MANILKLNEKHKFDSQTQKISEYETDNNSHQNPNLKKLHLPKANMKEYTPYYDS